MAQPLHSEVAIESTRIESEEFQKRLQEAGAIGVCRPVRVIASVAEPGCKVGEQEIVLHVVRHGQGFHNLLNDLYREMGRNKFNPATGEGGAENPYVRPEVLDPPLTEVGRRQARALRPKAAGLAPEMVVVSPLARATQTALIAFAHLVDGASTKVPFIAHEACHEIAGVHTCDRRRDLTEIRADFPMVDYTTTGLVESDPFWSETQREPLLQLAGRGYEFLLWLRARKEREVAVVAHFAWIFSLMNAVLESDDPKLKAGFLTGELRSLRLRFEDVGEPAVKKAKTGA